MSSSKKLLIIRLSSAGDVLLSSPLLKIIKNAEAESEIHFVVKSQYADIIRYNPNVDKVHLVQDGASIHKLENLHRELLGESFHSTLDLQNNFRSVYLRKRTSENIRVINKEVVKRALLVKTKLNLFSTVRSVSLKYTQVYDESIKEVPRPEIYMPDEILKRTDQLWKTVGPGSGKVIVLCPGAKHFTKRWPVEYWIEIAKKFSGRNYVVLLGGEADKEICSQIQRNADAINFSGELSLIESTAMLTHADLVITNDSFLMHAANALGKNIVAIFGSTVKEFGFFPYGVNSKILEVDKLSCRPCSHVGREKCPRGHFKCMLGTKPDAVYSAAVRLLEA